MSLLDGGAGLVQATLSTSHSSQPSLVNHVWWGEGEGFCFKNAKPHSLTDMVSVAPSYLPVADSRDLSRPAASHGRAGGAW